MLSLFRSGLISIAVLFSFAFTAIDADLPNSPKLPASIGPANAARTPASTAPDLHMFEEVPRVVDDANAEHDAARKKWRAALQSCIGKEGDPAKLDPGTRPKTSVPNAIHMVTVDSQPLSQLVHHELTKTLDPK